MEWEIDYRIVNIAPRGKVLRDPSSETAQWPTVVLMAPAADVAVESGERVVSANTANAASAATVPIIKSLFMGLFLFFVITR